MVASDASSVRNKQGQRAAVAIAHRDHDAALAGLVDRKAAVLPPQFMEAPPESVASSTGESCLD